MNTFTPRQKMQSSDLHKKKKKAQPQQDTKKKKKEKNPRQQPSLTATNSPV